MIDFVKKYIYLFLSIVVMAYIVICDILLTFSLSMNTVLITAFILLVLLYYMASNPLNHEERTPSFIRIFVKVFSIFFFVGVALLILFNILYPKNYLNVNDQKYDYIVDACDTITVKELLIKECHQRNINLITICGMGKKLDPTKIRICDIKETSYDPIAKILRKYVKEEKIKGKIVCVSSIERPINNDKKITSSMVMVPSTAGIFAASYIINNTINIRR